MLDWFPAITAWWLGGALIATTAGAGQGSAAGMSDVAEEPVHAYTLPASESGGVELAADGRTLFHVEDAWHVNAWALLAFRWPEAVFVLFVLSGAFVGMRYRRLVVRRRGREPGQPYCRRCGYRLSGLPEAGQCPECGAKLSQGRNVLVARPPWTRGRSALTAAGAVVAIGLAAVYPVRVVQTRAAHQPESTTARFHWDSRALHDFGESLDLQWVLLHAERVPVIVERRLSDGALVREFAGAGEHLNMGSLRLSPDGSTLWAADAHCIRSWSVGAGKPGPALQCPTPRSSDDPSTWETARLWVGPRAVMARALHSRTGKPRIAGWDLTTRQLEPIPASWDLEERVLTALPNGVHVLAKPAIETWLEDFGKVRLVDRRTGRQVPPGLIQVGEDPSATLVLLDARVSRDGRRVFATERWPGRYAEESSVRGWDLVTGKPLSQVGPVAPDRSVRTEPIGNGDRILVWYDRRRPGAGDLPEVWDVDSPRRVAVLDPKFVGGESIEPLISVDGRTIVLVEDSPYRGRSRRAAVFRLSR